MSTAEATKPDFQAAFQAWKQASNDWAESEREAPRAEWWECVDRLAQATCTDDALANYQFPAGTRFLDEMVLATPAMQEGDAPPYGLIEAIDLLDKARPIDKRRTESWAELWSLEGITGEQVAKMKGVPIQRALDAKRALDMRRNGLEFDSAALEEPESTPEERERMAIEVNNAREFKMAVEAYRDHIKAMNDVADAGADWEPPPESVEQLLSLPGISEEQIARMHRITIEEVQAIKRGSPLPPLEAESAPETQGTGADEIQALLDAGFSPEDIAKSEGVDVEQVKAIGGVE